MLFLLGVLLPLATLHCSSGNSLQILPSARQRGDIDTKVDLNTLKESLASMENGLDNFQLFNEIQEQTKPVADLRRLLSEVREDSNDIVKRNCDFRLGTLCLTEALDRVANQYHYLKSPHSPGRKRRQANDVENNA